MQNIHCNDRANHEKNEFVFIDFHEQMRLRENECQNRIQTEKSDVVKQNDDEECAAEETFAEAKHQTYEQSVCNSQSDDLVFVGLDEDALQEPTHAAAEEEAQRFEDETESGVMRMCQQNFCALLFFEGEHHHIENSGESEQNQEDHHCKQ